MRTQRGVYLIETLVALIIGSLLTIMLLQMLAQNMRLESSNSNKISADLIAQTVLDAVKAGGYGALQNGSYILVTYSTTPGELASGGHYLPVGLDYADLIWSSQSQQNKFNGTVTLTLSEGPVPSAQMVMVEVKYFDSQNLQGKTIDTMTILNQRGTQYWQ